VFSIDGLGEINAKYRIGSAWEKILANVQAASQTGVFLRWDFIVFRHNEHQMDEAREMARQLGFNQINFRSPSRLSLQQASGFEAPLNPEYAPQNIQQLNQIQEKHGSFEKYVKQTRIHCKTQFDSRSIYVDFRGEVWPCCWLGAPRYLASGDPQRRDLEKMIAPYEPGFNSIESFTLAEILAHPFYAQDLERSWRDPERRLFTCGRTCGQDFEFTCLPRYGNSHMETLKVNPDFNWVWE
jgi:MoaA/NifB/PqqE/SkfB family radical SAM enzyme